MITRLSLFAALLLASLPASAAEVPLEIAHQGRLLDSAGAPLDGSHTLAFSIYDAAAGGSAAWSETHTLEFDNGYFSATLGSSTPIDPAAFGTSALWLGLSVDGGAELPDRIALTSVPFAIRADWAATAGSADTATTATNVSGGSVDATELKINGTTLVDGSGKIDWSAISGAPADADSLAGITCDADQVLSYDGSAWGCADQASEFDAAAITSGTIDIARIPVGTASGTVAGGDHTHAASDITGAFVATPDGSSQVNAAKNCKELKAEFSSAPSGVYWLDPDGDGDVRDAFRTFCEMTRDGGGWTLVLQNNRTVVTRTNPSWATTVAAVEVRGGDLADDLGSFDLMLGLQFWGEIGKQARVEVGATPDKPTKQAMYSSFTLDATKNYTLNMSGQTITMGPSQPGIFAYHNGRPWTTIDKDNDASSGNCSTSYNQPWWYGACWSGSFWGSDTGSHQPAAFWDSSGSDYHNWGAIWLK